jgi:hypothetical protein
MTINRILKRQVGLRSDTKVRFCASVVLTHFCMEMKRVIKTNEGVTVPVAQTAQSEANAVGTAKDQFCGR